jgi:DNA ligase-1
MSEPFPMLAAPADLKKIKYPVLGLPKIDGIRAVMHDKQALSRKLLVLPNEFIQNSLAQADLYDLQGLDGELVVGAPNDPLCIKHSTSGVMSRDGTPDFSFLVFDNWDSRQGYHERHFSTFRKVERLHNPRVRVLPHQELRNEAELLEYETGCLDTGYEGIILRDPMGTYKHGRSTVREGGMLKLKRFSDSEAEVLEVIEEMHNGNEALKDNLGRTKRSSAKENKTGKGRMGALRVRDLKTNAVFEVGTGFTDADKAEWWAWWLLGDKRPPRIIKYKYFAVGMQLLPRHPVFLAIRDKKDM